MLPEDAYEIVALFMRYVFAGLAALIAALAFRWLWRDHAAYLRILKKAGKQTVGELVEPESGKRWALTQEGTIGSARSSDVCVRGRRLRRAHAAYRLVPGKGIRLTPIFRARVWVDGEPVRRSALILQHSTVEMGSGTFVAELSGELQIPQAPEQETPEREDREELRDPLGEEPEGWMRLFDAGTDPDGEDPLSPTAFPGFPEDGQRRQGRPQDGRDGT